MDKYPHLYQASASASPGEPVLLSSPGLHPITSLPPAQFGGPGDAWSPETLLIAAVADCFILTFRAIAKASDMEWLDLECITQGTLDRVDNVTRFTRLDISAKLLAPVGTDEHKAIRMLQKAEAVCLVSNSLNAEKHLVVSVEIAAD